MSDDPRTRAKHRHSCSRDRSSGWSQRPRVHRPRRNCAIPRRRGVHGEHVDRHLPRATTPMRWDEHPRRTTKQPTRPGWQVATDARAHSELGLQHLRADLQRTRGPSSGRRRSIASHAPRLARLSFAQRALPTMPELSPRRLHRDGRNRPVRRGQIVGRCQASHRCTGWPRVEGMRLRSPCRVRYMMSTCRGRPGMSAASRTY